VTTARRVVFPAPGQVTLEKIDVPEPGPAQVLLRTRYSLISSGTERTVLYGRYDAGTHWESYARFPNHPGYSAVGEIVAVGDEVTDVAVGDVVVARVGHASHHVVDALGCTRVPSEVDRLQAAWFAFAKIALMGARTAGYGLGARVLTIGAGPIGQMTVRWANAAGARVNAVVDPVRARLPIALRGGATAAISVELSDRDAILGACGGQQPDYVIDTTGNASVLAAVLPIVAFRGRVVILGNTGSPAQQHLTDDVITRCLTIAGAHDVLSMLQQPWDGDRPIHELFFHLVATGRFDLDGLITALFTPEDAEAAYRALDEHPDQHLGVGFDWNRS